MPRKRPALPGAINHTAVAAVMRALEEEQRFQRSQPEGSIPEDQMLYQVNPATGELLRWLVGLAPRTGQVIELGTSGGYSSLWITLGLLGNRRVLDTFEMNPVKIARARNTFSRAGLSAKIRQHPKPRASDFRNSRIAFCFLDTWKDSYLPLARLVVPRMVPGAILAADNIVSHRENLEAFHRWCHTHRPLAAVDVAIDSGLLLARRLA